MRLRFEAILLRRATIIKTITSNTTPAIIRIVAVSIEARSLEQLLDQIAPQKYVENSAIPSGKSDLLAQRHAHPSNSILCRSVQLSNLFAWHDNYAYQDFAGDWFP